MFLPASFLIQGSVYGLFKFLDGLLAGFGGDVTQPSVGEKDGKTREATETAAIVRELVHRVDAIERRLASLISIIENFAHRMGTVEREFINGGPRFK